MRFTTVLVSLALSSLSLLPTTLAQTPDGPIVPFTKLPVCTAECGKLWDVQGRCVPPNTKEVDDSMKSCFCQAAEVQPFSVGGPAGDCCASDVQGDLQKVKDWFDGFCAGFKAAPAAPGTPTTSTGTPATTAKATGTSTTTSAPIVKDNRTWIQSHYQWIIMAVILLVAFVGGWILACFFRKRHLRKRQANFELTPPHQPWVGTNDNTSPYGAQDAYGGGFGKEDEAVLGKKKKKWIVRERT